MIDLLLDTYPALWTRKYKRSAAFVIYLVKNEITYNVVQFKVKAKAVVTQNVCLNTCLFY